MKLWSVALLAGLLVANGAPPQSDSAVVANIGDGNNTRSMPPGDGTIVPNIGSTNVSSSQDAVCRDTPADRNSELCAAWAAADIGWWSAIWAFAQFVLGAAGLIGLIVTLYYTRKATNAAAAANADAAASLQVAQRNADAAQDMVRFSAENAGRELRAYLDFDEAKFLSAPDKDTADKGCIGFRCKVKNYGRTPATDVVLRIKLFCVDATGQPRSDWKSDISNVGMIAPGDHCGHNSWLKVPMELALDLRRGHKLLEVDVTVEYLDVFKQAQTIVSGFEGSDLTSFGVIDGSRKWS